MSDFMKHIFVVIVPLVLANSIHMVVVKMNLLHSIHQPLWVWGFGRNKTWRGMLFVPLANAMILTLLAAITPLDISSPAIPGFILGLGYMLSELPNSFVKRRMGIASGEHRGILFSVIDKMDSAVGVVLVYTLMGYATWGTSLLLLLIASTTHIAVSVLLVMLRLKSSF